MKPAPRKIVDFNGTGEEVAVDRKLADGKLSLDFSEAASLHDAAVRFVEIAWCRESTRVVAKGGSTGKGRCPDLKDLPVVDANHLPVLGLPLTAQHQQEFLALVAHADDVYFADDSVRLPGDSRRFLQVVDRLSPIEHRGELEYDETGLFQQ